MSALPPKADMFSEEMNVCFVPRADINEARGRIWHLVPTCYAAAAVNDACRVLSSVVTNPPAVIAASVAVADAKIPIVVDCFETRLMKSPFNREL